MKQYEVYLFDLDGTLTDTSHTWVEIFRDALTGLGVTAISDVEIAQHTHDWNSLSSFGLSPQQIEQLADAARKMASERLPAAPLHNGALDMLAELRSAGKQTGIVTSTNRAIFDLLMRGHPLTKLMDVTVAGGDIAQYKPHPAGIHRALELLRVPSDHYHTAVYIGDKDTDILAAHSAGIASALFFPPQHHALYDRAALDAINPGAVISGWPEFTLAQNPKQL